jgi:Ca-activated chloride channel family protein
MISVLGTLFCVAGQARQQAGESLRIPARPSSPLSSGAQGKQKAEIHFDTSSNTVTMKLLVQDPNGYFIPNLRPENFAVYENGVRQQNVNVQVEHAPVSLGVLMEYGGRAPSLDQILSMDIHRAVRQLADLLGSNDRIALWKYNDKVGKVVDFTQNHAAVNEALDAMRPPEFSETNLYDAIIFATDQMRPVPGRKAIVLVSSGIDTFSKANYETALSAAGNSDAPLYVISMVSTLRSLVELHESTGALAHTNWRLLEKRLEEIARVSGGRTYSPESTIDLTGIYDDMMENLRVRYVVTYRSSDDGNLNTPRTIRVEVVDPKTGRSLRIVDSNGRPVRPSVIVQGSYVPAKAAQPSN